MSSESYAIKVYSLSKCYQIYEKPADRLKQFIVPRLATMLGASPPCYYREYWALRNVDFEIRRGTAVGIVGRNGAGKSTLLQIICGVLTPTSGSVAVNGRIAALLELGSGFNPEYSGRENVYLNGLLLGLSRSEIDSKYDEIVEFASIGDFLDQPVKTYSSGMLMRLAFAVSYCVEPDILVVDEALAVGDARFQAKCYRKVQEIIDRGATVILVTHSTEQVVRHCHEAIWINDGKKMAQGEPRYVTNLYLDDLFGVKDAEKDGAQVAVGPAIREYLSNGFETRVGYSPAEYRLGSGGAEIVDFVLRTDAGDVETNIIEAGREVELDFYVRIERTIEKAIFGFQIKTPDGVLVFATNTKDISGGGGCYRADGAQDWRVSIKFTPALAEGEYFISLGISEEREGEIIPLDRRLDSIHVKVLNARGVYGLVDLPVCMNAVCID